MSSDYKGNTWSAVETFCIIGLWGEGKIEEELSGTHRNRTVYEKLSYKMREHGYSRSWEACRTKIKALRTQYLKAKQQNNTSGQERTKFMYFDHIDEFMGSRPIVEPTIIVNAGTESMNVTTDLIEEVYECEKKDDIDTEAAGDDQVDDATRLDVKDVHSVQKDTTTKDKPQTKNRKRKSTDDDFGKFMSSFMQMEAAQTRVFAEQEEKRRREEDQLELKRIEMDRQFQIQMFQMQTKLQMEMMSMFCQQMSQFPQQCTASSMSHVGPCGDDTGLSSHQMHQAMNYANFPGENAYHNLD